MVKKIKSTNGTHINETKKLHKTTLKKLVVGIDMGMLVKQFFMLEIQLKEFTETASFISKISGMLTLLGINWH